MTGLTDAMRADFKIMKEVGNITRVAPGARANGIDNFVKRVTGSPDAYKLLTNWGLKLGNNVFHTIYKPTVKCRFST